MGHTRLTDLDSRAMSGLKPRGSPPVEKGSGLVERMDFDEEPDYSWREVYVQQRVLIPYERKSL